ncbi:MAG TPA: UDP-N-acetylglucosamine 2-epimerase (non-hydrolyzing) [Planctomycetota bacterium]|nr:UDP-N-acetylglucosamine 2-epimerase (non-hydrolyzing) [Planctomycetota bacterium]
MRVLFAIGTRPEAVKLAPVVDALRRRGDGFDVRICATGQHRALLDAFLRTFELTPHHELGVMRPGQPLSTLVARLLEAFDRTLLAEKPDRVVVQGDTSTAFACALAAFHRGVPVCHVEAGLRTGDLAQPFPEEANRRLIAPLAALHCAPTERARRNLLREGVPGDRVVVTGNTVTDALRSPAAAAATPPKEVADLPAGDRLLLVTAHRRENFGAPLREICAAVREIVDARPDVRVVWPLHPNPAIAPTVIANLGRTDRVHLLEPLDYAGFIGTLKRATFALSDSGGVQEEGPTLGRPVLVLRDATERPEGVEAGAARLVGHDRRRIVDAALTWLDAPEALARAARAVDVYGDGRAAERVVDALAEVEACAEAAR